MPTGRHSDAQEGLCLAAAHAISICCARCNAAAVGSLHCSQMTMAGLRVSQAPHDARPCFIAARGRQAHRHASKVWIWSISYMALANCMQHVHPCEGMGPLQGMACLLLCQAIIMSRKASSLDRKEVKNSRLPPRHRISMELGKPQCRLLRTLVTSCNQRTKVLLRTSRSNKAHMVAERRYGHHSAHQYVLLKISGGKA